MDVMESHEEFTASNDHQSQIIIKGKRTKRPRPSSPFDIAAAVTTTTSSSSSGGGNGGVGGGDDCLNISSPMVSGETYESTTEEEEDLANCLILLAQSGGGCGPSIRKKEKSIRRRKFIDTSANIIAGENNSGKMTTGLYVYECKTCNRSFPSFQALGGHRASHKKPKALAAAAAMIDQEKKLPPITPPSFEDDRQFEFEGNQFNNNNNNNKMIIISPNSLTLQLSNNNNNNKSSKVHECSICGSEFSSGQALGGHMRRHRSIVNTTTAQITLEPQHDETEEKKPKNIFSLDLNLPAPPEEDEHNRRDTNFRFSSSQRPPLVFSTPSLVDCHY